MNLVEMLRQAAGHAARFPAYAAENPLLVAAVLLALMFVPKLLLGAVMGQRRSDAERAAEKEWATKADVRHEGLFE